MRRSPKTIQAEEGNIVRCLAALRAVGHDLADDAREFEAVPGARRCERDLGMIGAHIEDEVVARRTDLAAMMCGVGVQ